MGGLERSKPNLSYSAEPGLRFALLLDGKALDAADARVASTWTPADRTVWCHFERDHSAPSCC